jgi:hypothetical protein
MVGIIGFGAQRETAVLSSMANYHQTTKMVKRSDGRNAVAAAAYRSGTSMYEEATGQTHDYSKKLGVEHSEIMAPANAPEWVFDRQVLWNQVEAAEHRRTGSASTLLTKDARVPSIRGSVVVR